MRKDGIAAIGIILGLICAIASCILAITFTYTEIPIRNAKLQAMDKALKAVLPEFDNAPANEELKVDYPGREIVFYPAKKNNRLVGIAASAVSPKGYSGNLRVIAGISPDGKIITVIVTEKNETPGLGTAVTDRGEQKTIFSLLGKSCGAGGLPANPVLDSFQGKDVSTAPWKVKKDGGEIESVTGATISSRAVTDAVNMIAAAYTENREDILKKFQKSEGMQ